MQDAIAVALSKVCLKIHPQAAGNILYSLGKLEIYDSVQSSSSLPTNFQVALELAIRNSAGKCRDTDIIQLLQGMALLRMRWEDLAPSTKETLCVPIYNIAIRWGTVDGPKSAVEIGTTLYHLSKLQVSWKSLPPTFRAMVIIGVIAITDFELLSPDMDQRKSDAKLRSSVENGRNARPSLAIQPGDRSRTIDEWIMQANIDNEICEDPEDVSEETSGKARQYLISKIMKIVNRDDPQRLLLLEKAVDVDKIESTNSDTIDKMEDNESSISAVKQIVGAIVSEDRNRISGKDISDAVRAANTYEEILWKLENMARPSFSAPSENSIRKNDDFFEIYGVSKGFDGEKTGVSDFRIESSDASAMQYDWKDAKRISPLEYSSADSVELSLGDEFKKEYARALASIIYSLSQFEFLQVVDIFPFEALNSLYYALAKYSSFFTGQGLAMTVISLGKLHMRWDSIVPPAVRSALIKSFQEFLINDHYDLSTKEENSIQTVANTLKGLAEMGCTFSDVDKPVQTSLLIWLDGVYSLQKSGTMFDASTEEFPIYISGTFGRHVVELLSSIVWFGVPFVHISDFLRFKLCAKSLHMLRYAPRDFSNSQEQIRYSNGNFEAIVKGLDTGKYKLVKQEEDSVKVEFVPEENDNNYMKLFVRDLILCLREFSEIGIDFDYLRRFTMVSAMSEHHPLGPVERFVGENITSMRYWNYYRFRASEDKGVELTIADEYSRSFYAENGVIRVFKSILQTKKLSYTAQGSISITSHRVL